MEISNQLGKDNPVYVSNHKRRQVGNVQNVNFPKGRLTVFNDDLSVNDIDLVSSGLNNQGELTNFPQGQTAQQRETDQVFLKGFRIDWSFINTSNEDVFWHMAIVHPKDNARPTTEQLLRTYTSARALDLDGNISGVDGLKPLNSDKFDVMWHTKWKVGALLDTTTQLRRVSGMHPTCQDTNYIPINRWITYGSGDGTSCNDKFYLIAWCVSLNRRPGEALSQLIGATQIKAYTMWEDMM
jgi:hypothetical protein